MNIQQLLYHLSDGEFHSGSELGNALGLSRTSVWKLMSHLKTFSIELEVVKGKGYCIPGGLDLLVGEEIYPKLSAPVAELCELELLMQCSSTNDHIAKKLSLVKSDRFQVCFSEMQTDGRGRRGRTWVSPFARNIYMSVGFKLHGGVEVLSGLSLVVGLAMAVALTRMGLSGSKVKWPNDVLVNGKKICGVLIELQGEATTGWTVVCGIGMNVGMTEQDGCNIEQQWTTVKQNLDSVEGRQVTRNHVAAVMLDELIKALEIYKAYGFQRFLNDWCIYDYLLGKELTITPSGLKGVGAGIDSHGALLVDVVGNLKVVNAGEVSVRLL
jgi:BirA family biotin operon repressor/biotin-[acetyl-CoA-carboxylase] ligase